MSYFINKAKSGLSSLKSMVSTLWSYVPNIRGDKQQEEVKDVIENVNKVIDEVQQDVNKASEPKTWRDQTRNLYEMGTKKEQKLRRRLLPNHIREQLLDRKTAGTASKYELRQINQKLEDDVKERMRQAKHMRGLKGRKKEINDKYSELLNHLGGRVKYTKDKRSLKNGLIIIYNITYRGSGGKLSIVDYLEFVKNTVVELMSKHPNTRFSMTLNYMLIKLRILGNNNNPERKKGYTPTKARVIYPNDDFSSIYDEEKVKLISTFGEEEHKGSGWMLEKILDLDIKFTKHNTLRI